MPVAYSIKVAIPIAPPITNLPGRIKPTRPTEYKMRPKVMMI